MTEPGQYEVEKIVGHKGGPVRRAAKSYFVKWVDYSKNDNTWEPAEMLENSAKDIVGFYWHDRLVAEKRLSEMSEHLDSSRNMSNSSDISEVGRFYQAKEKQKEDEKESENRPHGRSFEFEAEISKSLSGDSETPSNSELTASDDSDSEMPGNIDSEDSEYDSKQIDEIISSNDFISREVIREIAAISHPFLMSLKKEIIQSVDAKMEHLQKVTKKQNTVLFEKITNELKNNKK